MQIRFRMRSKANRGIVVGFVAVTAFGASPAARAADSTWTGAADLLWANDANWSALAPGSTTVTTSPDTATFGATGGTITVDANRNVAGITFNGAAPAFTLTGGSLLLSANGTVQTTGAGVANQTITSPIVLEGSYTFASNYTTAALLLNIGGNISGGVAGTNTLTLAGTNVGVNTAPTTGSTISGIISNGIVGSILAINKPAAATGSWVLSGANTYTGGTTVAAGVLRVAASSSGAAGSLTSGPIGTGTLTLTGGAFSSDSTTARTINNAVTFGGNVTLGSSVNTGALTFGAPATLTGTRQITAGSAVNYNGVISESGGSFGITKAGAGTLVLGAANALTGPINISAGILQIAADNRLGTNPAATLTVASGGQLLLSAAGTFGMNRTIVINGSGVNSVGNLTSSTTSGTIWAGSVSVATDGSRIGAGVASGFLDVAGVISGTNTAPAVRSTDGAGVVQFSNANTYNGTNTLVVVGGLKLNNANALPGTTGLTFGNNAGAGSANANLNGFSPTLLGVQTVSGNTTPTTITSATAATLTVGNSTAAAYVFGDIIAATTYGQITGSIALAKTGTNTQTLAGLANTYTGGTTVGGGGTLALSVAATLGTGNVTVNPAAGANSVLNLSASTPAAAGVIADTATLTLATNGANFGQVAFGANTLNEAVGGLVVNGATILPGTYTSSDFPNNITGSGSITVVPEPATIGILVMGAAALMSRRRLRRGSLHLHR